MLYIVKDGFKELEVRVYRPVSSLLDECTTALWKAEKRFRSRSLASFRFPFIEYAIFNGDKHPGDQGFNSHEMTAILATNVIHATMHLASTMATIHILLQPGGHIVFNEVQNPGTLIEDCFKML